VLLNLEVEMTDWKAKWQDTLKDLEQKRDELRVQAHLAKTEARDELTRLEGKIDELKARAGKAGDQAHDVMDDVSKKANIIAAELKESMARIKERMKTEGTK
jgi:predicted  nucleic acid-binding Zn-ribbon protein